MLVLWLSESIIWKQQIFEDSVDDRSYAYLYEYQ